MCTYINSTYKQLKTLKNTPICFDIFLDYHQGARFFLAKVNAQQAKLKKTTVRKQAKVIKNKRNNMV